MEDLPEKNNETIEAIALVIPIGMFAKDSHGEHFDEHFNGEETKNNNFSKVQTKAEGFFAFVFAWIDQ